MKVIGLTGSIAMGKSSVARLFHTVFHIPVWNADKAVHRLYRMDRRVFKKIQRAFPESIYKGAIDRKKLGDSVFREPSKLEQLEDIVYPHLEEQGRAFIHKCRLWGQKYCVLDIPLLFEKGWDIWCHRTIVVYSPAVIQQQRLKKRHGNPKHLEAIIDRQLKDLEKFSLADFILPTSLSRNHTLKEVQKILATLEETVDSSRPSSLPYL